MMKDVSITEEPVSLNMLKGTLLSDSFDMRQKKPASTLPELPIPAPTAEN